jgi:hypothetical protein
MKKVVNWIMKFFVNVKTKKNCFSWYTCYSFFNFGYFLYIKKESRYLNIFIIIINHQKLH